MQLPADTNPGYKTVHSLRLIGQIDLGRPPDLSAKIKRVVTMEVRDWNIKDTLDNQD